MEESQSVRRVLFTYGTEHLQYKDKIRFYYGLKGRDGKSGIVKDASIEQLGKTVLLVPEKKADSVRSFLESWKCRFEARRVILNAA